MTKFIGSVAYSALVLFILGLGCISILILVNRVQPSALSTFQSAPLYSYISGIIVAFYVLSITYLVPRIGVGNAIGFIVTGQIITAAVIDHFGLLGTTIHSLSWSRSIGLIFMISGLFLARS